VSRLNGEAATILAYSEVAKSAGSKVVNLAGSEVLPIPLREINWRPAAMPAQSQFGMSSQVNAVIL
jgi:hypothetical protein